MELCAQSLATVMQCWGENKKHPTQRLVSQGPVEIVITNSVGLLSDRRFLSLPGRMIKFHSNTNRKVTMRLYKTDLSVCEKQIRCNTQRCANCLGCYNFLLSQSAILLWAPLLKHLHSHINAFLCSGLSTSHSGDKFEQISFLLWYNSGLKLLTHSHEISRRELARVQSAWKLTQQAHRCFCPFAVISCKYVYDLSIQQIYYAM